MIRRHCPRRPVRLKRLTALFRDPKLQSQQRLSRGGTHEHEDLRLDRLQLCLQPWPASENLARIRLTMQAPLTSRCPFKVLDRIRDIHELPWDACFFQQLIEQPAGRTDERLTLPVLHVPRLLADHHHLCSGRSRTKDRLGCVRVKWASLAVLRRLAQRCQIVFLRQKRACGGCCNTHGEVRGGKTFLFATDPHSAIAVPRSS